MREAFREWLSRQGYTKSTQQTQWTDAKRLEDHYGDLDALYDRDEFAELKTSLKYSKEDERAGKPNPAKFDIDGNLYSNLASYRATLTYFSRFRLSEREGESGSEAAAGFQIDRAALEEMKAAFLGKFPDFEKLRFQASQGGYWDEERKYKQELILQVEEAADDPAFTPFALGERILNILGSSKSNLLGWRMANYIGSLRKKHSGVLENTIGELIIRARTSVGADYDLASVIDDSVDEIWSLYQEDNPNNHPYSDTRTIPTTALALAMPSDAIAIRHTPFQAAAQRLLHRNLFASDAPLTASEYRDALGMAQAIRKVMEDEWGWEPRDLWDVQGFLWVTRQIHDATNNPQEATERQMSSTEPLNLILYGPPGTGKTFETAERAVRICDGSVPGSRSEVMKRYNELVARKRIAFVTFHQSYAYEDFVEGLRPETGRENNGTGDSSGFSLSPHPGIFKTIAELARDNRGRSTAASDLDRNRRVFKVALGRRGEDESDRLFRAAINENYIVLGWGGEIDWSDPQYDDFQAIKARWQTEDPTASGKDANIEQVFSFRSWMRPGDLVVISDGRDRFKAIGEVDGPYTFVQGERDEYNHHRPVKWLWHDSRGLSRDVIYPRWFRGQSVYELDPKLVNWPALEQVISGASTGTSQVAQEPYVLIIDEINRANISKVFGELITLIEKDKRVGNDNALTVTLPYSGETFGVPSNLHIIGTMNTADRSIALLDTALRRRFQFEELMPKPHLLADDVAGIDLRALLTKLNERIEYLFDREHQIGHAYFMACGTKEKVDDVMRTKVIPLLSEYFYENWEKVRQVLGETADEGGFVVRSKIAAPGGSAIDFGTERWRYTVRDTFKLDAYKQLLS